MTATQTRATGGIGTDAARPDGVHKVRGEFAYSSDMWLDNMLWGATLRSPHPRARIVGIDITEAIRTPGVHAVLTCDDVPGRNRCGLEVQDQPVLAEKEARYEGEPVAIVAADHPEIARQAAKKIAVTYEVLPPITDAVQAVERSAPNVHDEPVPGHDIDGNVLRHVHIERGRQDVTAPVVVTGEYEVGMQDQAFLGPESGLAVPAEDGGVDLYIATQWLHADRDQVAVALGLPAEKVRFTLAGVGGAFGGREDVSMQAHACLLALRTNRPVKMVYSREESFYGHVHRHPAVLRYEHGASHDGRLIYVRATIVLDGGAYASSSTAVAANAATLGFGPYEVPNLTMDCRVVVHEQPAVRGDARVRCGAGVLRVRVADGSPGCRVRARSGRGARAQRVARRIGDADRSGGRFGRAGRGVAAPGRGGAAAGWHRSMSATCSICPVARPTRRTVNPYAGVLAMASASRTSDSPRDSTTPRRFGYAWRWSTVNRSPRCSRPPPRSARVW